MARTGRRTPPRRALLLAAAALAACVAPEPAAAPAARGAVVYGTPDHEHPATVMLTSPVSNCSGSLIAPTVVLTANHCVDGTRAGDWQVRYGQVPTHDSMLVGTEIVSPGPFTTESRDDIALLVVRVEVPAEPYMAAVDLPEDLVGSTVTIIGYGLDENGGAGRRLIGRQQVVEVTPWDIALYGRQSADSGDSGGTVLDSRGQVVGVISRGGMGVTIATRVDAFRWLVDPVLRANRGCVPGDPELCDGYDNNCDGVVDEGCLDRFERCESDEICTTGLCADVAGERICTTRCASDGPRCGEGAYCAETACGEGLCRPGEPGEGVLGDPCADDLECASLICRAPEGGDRRCTVRCEPDALDCPAGSVCVPGEGCGACLPAGEVAGPYGLGEPCREDPDCRSSFCTDGGYCSVGCDERLPCPAGTRCRDAVCRLGEPAGVGHVCVGPADCESQLCAALGDWDPICTETCGPGNPCPSRWSCDFELGRCLPWDPPEGARCDPEDSGCTVGDCVELGGDRRCARPCGAYCPEGFECRQTDGGRYCWPSAVPQAAGCGCAAPGRRARPGRAAASELALVAMVLLVAGRLASSRRMGALFETSGGEGRR